MTKNRGLRSSTDEKKLDDYRRMGVKIPLCLFCKREYVGPYPGYCSRSCWDESQKIIKSQKTPKEQEYIELKKEYKIIIEKLEKCNQDHQILSKEYKIILEILSKEYKIILEILSKEYKIILEKYNQDHQILSKEYKIILEKLEKIKSEL